MPCFAAVGRRLIAHAPRIASPVASRHFVVEACEPRRLLAAPVLVDTNKLGRDASPGWITDVGGTAFFAATTTELGRELWKSDGTAAGTVLVKDVVAGPTGSDPRGFVAAGDTLYFSATAASVPSRRELWKSDGTDAGTVRVSSRVEVVHFGAGPQPLVVGGIVYFQGSGDDGSGAELWRSDGTDAGTSRVKDLNPGPAGSAPDKFFEFNGQLFFEAAAGAANLRQLWRTNGTDAGTFKIADSGTVADPTRLGNSLYFIGGQRLYRSNGTAVGTAPFFDEMTFTEIERVGDRLYFTANEAMGESLWVSDGTAAGTRKILFFNYDRVGSHFVHGLTEYEGNLLFKVGYGGYGAVWKLDVATEVAERIQHTGITQWGAGPLTRVGGQVFFVVATDGPTQLWLTDGTSGGTRPIHTFRSTLVFFPPVDVGGLAFFGATAPETGNELYTSDGTDAGTRLVKDVHQGTLAANPYELEDVDGTLYFASAGYVHRVNDARDGATAIDPRWIALRPLDLTGSGDMLFFTVHSPSPQPYGPYLARSDGTPEGTTRLSSLSPDDVQFVTDLDGRGTVLFSARDSRFPRVGDELYRSDGTPEGTARVRDIRPGTGDSFPNDLVNLGGVILFSADDGESGRELWKSDGTEAGTVRVKDVVPGAPGSDPRGLVVVGSRLYFRASLPGGTTELWKSDGTEAGTVRVAAVGAAPWAGLPRYVSYQPFYPGDDFSRGVGLGDLLVFAAADPAGGTDAGVELWRSDGTEAGTYRLKDVAPGPASSDPAWFEVLDGKVYFAASDGAAGRELWATDGTEAGTTRVADVVPGPESGDPAWLTASGGSLWFAGNSPLYGRELWKFTPDPPAPAVIRRGVFYHHAGWDISSTAPAAIAPNKTALLPGQRATFANVTNYDRGINGLFVDFTRLPSGPLSGGDVELHFGRGSTWTRLPVVPFVVHGIEPSDGRRAYLALPDGTVKNAWLRVTIKANANTGLANPDVFYFGNLVGETGDPRRTELAVDRMDFARVSMSVGTTSAAARAAYDINRDGAVTSADVLLVRSNQRRSLTLLTAPAARAGEGDGQGTSGSVPVAPARAPTPPRRRTVFGEPSEGLLS